MNSLSLFHSVRKKSLLVDAIAIIAHLGTWALLIGKVVKVIDVAWPIAIIPLIIGYIILIVLFILKFNGIIKLVCK